MIDLGHGEAAVPVVEDCLARTKSPRLVLRKAMLLAAQKRFPEAIALLHTVATPAYPQAMMDVALFMDAAKRRPEALAIAREVTRDAPRYAAGHRSHGKIAFNAGLYEEARAAFERAYQLDPRDAVNEYNLGLSLLRLGREWEAYPHFIACSIDSYIGASCRQLFPQ
jgi:tetratricopeptide (TPR) repeat protein